MLVHRTPAEMRAIKLNYMEHWGSELIQDLRKNCGMAVQVDIRLTLG